MARYQTSGEPLLAERLHATGDLLASAPDDAYSIELYVTRNTDPARVERFLARAQTAAALDKVYVIPLPGAPARIWVMFGSFPSLEAAIAGRKGLPEEYQRDFKSVPRSFAEIRHAL